MHFASWSTSSESISGDGMDCTEWIRGTMMMDDEWMNEFVMYDRFMACCGKVRFLLFNCFHLWIWMDCWIRYSYHLTLSTRYTCDNDNWTIEQAPLPPRYPFLATCPLLRSYFSGTFDQSYLRYSLCMGIWKGMTFRLKHDQTLVVKWAYGYWTWVFKMGHIYLRVSSILPKARVFVRLEYPFLLPTDTYTHLPTHPDEVK